MFGGLEGGLGEGSDFSTCLTIAHQRAGLSLDSQKSIFKACTFCIYSWAGVVGNGGAVHVGCGATWLFKCACIMTGHGGVQMCWSTAKQYE